MLRFDPSANPPLNADFTPPVFPFTQPALLAAGAGPTAGSLFLEDNGSGTKFSKIDASTGALDYVIDPNPEGLGTGSSFSPAVNPSNGHPFAAKDVTTQRIHVVTEYDASGAAPSVVSTATPPRDINGIASSGASDLLYVAVEGDAQVSVYGPPVPVPDVTTDPAQITGLDAAGLSGTVNPDGGAVTDCHFEYLTDAAYEANASTNRFAGAATADCAESLASLGAGHSPLPVHADVSGLQTPGVLYHFRLLAASANGSVGGPERTLTTPDKPVVSDSWTASATTDSGTVKAIVDPKNAATTFHVDFGPDNTYGHSTAEAAVGSDDAEHTVTATIPGLDPDTTYHYRFVATNPLGVAQGPDRTLATYPVQDPQDTGCANQAYRSGTPSAGLPDCRAYEMVSPPEKGGFGVENPANGVDLASTGGDRFTFTSPGAFGGSAGAPFSSQYLATRAGSGWQRAAISPPLSTPALFSASSLTGSLLRYFSPDLCLGWVLHPSPAPLAPGAPAGYTNLYSRENCGSEAGAYRAITTVAPPGFAAGAVNPYLPAVDGASADGSLTAFRADAALSAEASDATGITGSGRIRPIYQSYAGREGQLRLVSVLPDGTAAAGDSSVGSALFTYAGESYGRQDSVHHAVSDDGSRIFWTLGDTWGRVYVRIDPDPNFEGDEFTEDVSGPTDPARFLDANPQGTEALYSTYSGDLYSFDVDADTRSLIAHGFSGLLGASTDLSRVYFVSSEALSAQANPRGDTAQAGQPNLYLYRRGEGFTFITTLTADDAQLTGAGHAPNPVDLFKRAHTSRVSPDGAHLAFGSRAPLTGADNTDAASGQPDTEVFLYDASAGGGAGELRCVSCNRVGARPAGADQRAEVQSWVAATLPGWPDEFRPGHVLAEDGSRLFFESVDPLTPADTNGKQDVYEWEAAGSGRCEVADSSYDPAAGGCVSLITSGKDSHDSELLDASADGRDVFVRTNARLAGGDSDDRADVYDARAGGGLPAPVSTPPCDLGAGACEGTAAAAPAQQGAGSAAFSGQGDVAEPIRRDCAPAAKRARRLAVAAKRLGSRAARLRRAARRATDRRRRALRRKAGRLTGIAKRRRRGAKRLRSATRRCRVANRKASR